MEENIYGIIYKFTSKTTKKSYIGQTISSNLKRRIYRHRTDKIDSHFYRARDKYGFDDFEFSIIETNISLKDGKKLLDEREIYWIRYYDSYNNGYNSTPGGHGGNTYSKKTNEELLEIKKKLSISKVKQDKKRFEEKLNELKDFIKKNNRLPNKDDKSIFSFYSKHKKDYEIKNLIKSHKELIKEKLLKDKELAKQEKLKEKELIKEKLLKDKELAKQEKLKEKELIKEKLLKDKELAKQEKLKEKELIKEKLLKDKELAKQEKLKEKELIKEKLLKDKELAKQEKLKEKELIKEKLLKDKELAKQEKLKEKELIKEKLLKDKELAKQNSRSEKLYKEFEVFITLNRRYPQSISSDDSEKRLYWFFSRKKRNKDKRILDIISGYCLVNGSLNFSSNDKEKKEYKKRSEESKKRMSELMRSKTFKNSKKVTVTNIVTGETIDFSSYRECSRYFNVTGNTIRKRVKKRLLINDWQF